MKQGQRFLVAKWRDSILRPVRDSAALRCGLWLAAALVVLQMILLCGSWRELRVSEYRVLAADWLKLQEIAGQTQWPERAKQAEDALAKVRERLWQTENASQARADVQGWLHEKVLEAGVSEPRITVLAPREPGPGSESMRIEGQVRGILEPHSFGYLLHILEYGARPVRVDYMEIDNGISPSFNLHLSFPFLAAVPEVRSEMD